MHSRRQSRSRRPQRWAAIPLLMTVAILSGCGTAGERATGEGDDAKLLSAAAERVRVATAPVEAEWSKSAVAAGTDKRSVVLVPCNQSQPGCTQPAIGARQAIEALGWKAHMIDGKGTGDNQNAAVMQALSLRPDAIMTFAIDPSTIQQSLKAARGQDVPVISSAGEKSDLVASSVNPRADVYTTTGSLLADLAIVENDAQVKALVLHDTGFSVLGPRYEGFVNRLGECAGCEVLEEQNFTAADLAVGLPRLVQQLVQRHPDFNTIYVDYDDAVPPLLQALKSLGVKDKTVLASNGTVQATECIAQECGQTATTAFSLEGIGWAAVDQLTHIWAGEDPARAVYPLGVKLITSENADQIDGMWDGDSDYRKIYLKRWGVES